MGDGGWRNLADLVAMSFRDDDETAMDYLRQLCGYIEALTDDVTVAEMRLSEIAELEVPLDRIRRDKASGPGALLIAVAVQGYVNDVRRLARLRDSA